MSHADAANGGAAGGVVPEGHTPSIDAASLQPMHSTADEEGTGVVRRHARSPGVPGGETHTWRCSWVGPHVRGGKLKRCHAVIDGVRVTREAHWGAATTLHDAYLIEAIYYTTNKDLFHRSWEAALAAADQPIESNEP